MRHFITNIYNCNEITMYHVQVYINIRTYIQHASRSASPLPFFFGGVDVWMHLHCTKIWKAPTSSEVPNTRWQQGNSTESHSGSTHPWIWTIKTECKQCGKKGQWSGYGSEPGNLARDEGWQKLGAWNRGSRCPSHRTWYRVPNTHWI